ncbi:MAG: hypothetical protein AABZ47_19155 [Planctomycetota bacterium]
MEVFVDHSKLNESFDGTRTVQDAVRVVQEHACSPGRLVVRLQFDGQDIKAEGMTAALQCDASALTRLDVFTASRGELVIDTMNQASLSLQETEEGCHQAAEMLGQGKVQEGMDTLAECLRIWQQVHQAVIGSIEMLGLDIMEATFQDAPLLDAVTKPKAVLFQIRDALKVNDHVLLADLLEYELSDVTNQWFSIIAHLREEADSTNNSPSEA